MEDHDVNIVDTHVALLDNQAFELKTALAERDVDKLKKHVSLIEKIAHIIGVVLVAIADNKKS